MPSGRRITSGRCARRDMLADYDVYWFEEPLRPGQSARLRAAAEQLAGADCGRRGVDAPAVVRSVAAAAGVRYRAAGRRRRCGGISEERRIAWMAEENGVRFIPHGWNTALGLAADLQLASASRKTDLVEYLRARRSSTTWWRRRGNWMREGMLAIPDGAGIGRRARIWTRWRSTRASDSARRRRANKWRRPRERMRRSAPQLGMLDATAIVIGIVIGSGIFVLPNVIARNAAVVRRHSRRLG